MSVQATLNELTRRMIRLEDALREATRLATFAPLYAGQAKLATIASGSVDYVRPFMRLLPESGTADDLDTITPASDGQLVLVTVAEDGDAITLRPYTVSGGNIDLRGAGNGRTLNDQHDSVLLYYRAATGHWEQVSPNTLDGLIGVVLEEPLVEGQVLGLDETLTWTNIPAPSGGVDEFIELTDVPASYVGQAGKVAAVNVTEDALEFIVPPSGGVDEFVELTDVPASYVGQAGKVTAVNVTEDALEFVTLATVAFSGDYDDLTDKPTILTLEDVEDTTAAQLTGNAGRVQFSYDDITGVLTAILDVSAADRYLYSTAADTWAEGAITAFARGLLDDADAATMRTTLGLVIGTNVQAYDAELAALAGLTSAADRLPYFTGSGTASLAVFTAFARNLLDDADAATMRTTLGITVYDQETTEDATAAQLTGNTGRVQFSYNDTSGLLTAILDVSAADRYLYSTAADTWAEGAITAFARGLLDDADAATMRSTLGLGTIATEAETAYLLLAGRSGGQRVTGVAGTGAALEVYRNMAASNTDSPVFSVIQDAATDDQPASYVRNDSTTGDTALFVKDGVGNSLVKFATYSATASHRSVFFLQRARGSLATPGAISSGDLIGDFVFYGYDGTDFREAAKLSVVSDGTPGASDMPGRMDFYTTPPGSATPVQRMRIDSAGNFGIGINPVGRLHWHDGISGGLGVTKTAVDGTPQTVVPNGTGDIVRGYTGQFIARGSSGSFYAGALATVQTPGAGNTDQSIGGGLELTLRLASTGALTVFRASGTETWNVTLDLIWQ